jgi:hypothetical protein
LKVTFTGLPVEPASGGLRQLGTLIKESCLIIFFYRQRANGQRAQPINQLLQIECHIGGHTDALDA